MGAAHLGEHPCPVQELARLEVLVTQLDHVHSAFDAGGGELLEVAAVRGAEVEASTGDIRRAAAHALVPALVLALGLALVGAARLDAAAGPSSVGAVALRLASAFAAFLPARTLARLSPSRMSATER